MEINDVGIYRIPYTGKLNLVINKESDYSGNMFNIHMVSINPSEIEFPFTFRYDNYLKYIRRHSRLHEIEVRLGTLVTPMANFGEWGTFKYYAIPQASIVWKYHNSWSRGQTRVISKEDRKTGKLTLDIDNSTGVPYLNIRDGSLNYNVDISSWFNQYGRIKLHIGMYIFLYSFDTEYNGVLNFRGSCSISPEGEEIQPQKPSILPMVLPAVAIGSYLLYKKLH